MTIPLHEDGSNEPEREVVDDSRARPRANPDVRKSGQNRHLRDGPRRMATECAGRGT